MIMETRMILFKAKRLDNGKWVKGDLYHRVDKYFITWADEKSRTRVLVDPSTVCQFTGIYDKDNKEIFENDLVQGIQTKMVFVVVWNAVYACYSFLDERRDNIAAKNFANYPSKDFLIVGNKFDRKEGEYQH